MTLGLCQYGREGTSLLKKDLDTTSPYCIPLQQGVSPYTGKKHISARVVVDVLHANLHQLIWLKQTIIFVHATERG